MWVWGEGVVRGSRGKEREDKEGGIMTERLKCLPQIDVLKFLYPPSGPNTHSTRQRRCASPTSGSLPLH